MGKLSKSISSLSSSVKPPSKKSARSRMAQEFMSSDGQAVTNGGPDATLKMEDGLEGIAGLFNS
jgi:hypothetical protein